MKCEVPECPNAIYAKGHCRQHYQQQLRTGRTWITPATCPLCDNKLDNNKRIYCRTCRGGQNGTNAGPAKQVRHLVNRYGLSRDEAISIVRQAQTSKTCPVCGESEAPLDLDHRHSDGKIRGLICRRCNLTLGQARESIHRLRMLADYLSSHG